MNQNHVVHREPYQAVKPYGEYAQETLLSQMWKARIMKVGVILLLKVSFQQEQWFFPFAFSKHSRPSLKDR